MKSMRRNEGEVVEVLICDFSKIKGEGVRKPCIEKPIKRYSRHVPDVWEWKFG